MDGKWTNYAANLVYPTILAKYFLVHFVSLRRWTVLRLIEFSWNKVNECREGIKYIYDISSFVLRIQTFQGMSVRHHEHYAIRTMCALWAHKITLLITAWWVALRGIVDSHFRERKKKNTTIRWYILYASHWPHWKWNQKLWLFLVLTRFESWFASEMLQERTVL